MITKKIDHMDLKQIAGSGQCFRWRVTGEASVNIIAFGKSLNVTQDGDEFTFDCSEEEWNEIWYDYFDLDTDYNHIEKIIMSSGDEHLKESFRLGSGIRILKQELWEIVISFMISQNNNIGRITKTVELLCDRCGKVIPGSERKSFPGLEDIDLTVFDDRSMGFGYRADYLRGIYSLESFAKEAEMLINADYDAAMELLLKHKGIGKKVANCICLFGLHQVNAFPIDTHVKQILEKYYSGGFDFEKYRGFAGIIQQYLFYYELMA